jgi:bifunctional non-homologous end joining protein LigD
MLSAAVTRPTPMRLLRVPEPFDSPDFVFEPKIDGFRALAHVDGHRCTLVSRNGHVFKSWPQLNEEIAHAVRASRVVLDGEICCLDPDGRSNFNALLFRREWPYFYAFDLLALEGHDLTHLPLLERKPILMGVLPAIDCRLLYLGHLAERGRDFYRVACERDLEGVVAKWAHGTYQTDGRGTSWLKIKNPEYSQIVDRHELFARREPPRHRHHAALRPELRLA